MRGGEGVSGAGGLKTKFPGARRLGGATPELQWEGERSEKSGFETSERQGIR